MTPGGLFRPSCCSSFRPGGNANLTAENTEDAEQKVSLILGGLGVLGGGKKLVVNRLTYPGTEFPTLQGHSAPALGYGIILVTKASDNPPPKVGCRGFINGKPSLDFTPCEVVADQAQAELSGGAPRDPA